MIQIFLDFLGIEQFSEPVVGEILGSCLAIGLIMLIVNFTVGGIFTLIYKR